VEQGQASRVMTGASQPQGADAVVPVEQTRTSGKPNELRVEVLSPSPAGTHVRRRGSDMAAGTLVLRAGTECGPAEIGALAALSRPVVTVGRRPTVAILATGDELIEPHEPLLPGRIVNSNGPALAALVRQHGGVPVVLPTAPDRRDVIRAAFASAASADFILSSGGVSVGDHDYVKEVLAELGARPVFWRVAMKPGKPLYFSVLEGKPCFGLPGNPVSSMVSFLQFVRPAIRRAVGYRDGDLLLPSARALVDGPVRNQDDRRGYLRAALRFDHGRLRARVMEAQGSHQLTSMLGASGLVVIEPGEAIEAGGEVTVQVIGPIRS
jgi:molybdopterin molybdotransferase